MKKRIIWALGICAIVIACINVLPVIQPVYEQNLINNSVGNLRNLWPALFAENQEELDQSIDSEKVRKLQRYTGDINGIPNLMICPISGKPYVYRPFSGKRGQVDFKSERRIVAYSPEPTRTGKRVVLEGDEGTVLILTNEQFKEAAENNFVYRLPVR